MFAETCLKRAPLLLAGLIALAYLFLRRVLQRRQTARRYGCQPVAHSLNWDPFLGLDLIPLTIRAAREHKMLEHSCRHFRELGTTWKAREMLNTVVVTIEPENVKAILSTSFKDYGVGFRLEHFAPLLGAGIFDSDGEHWAASRALVRPNFARDQVADLTSFESLIQDMFALLPRDGTTVVDLQALFFRYTMDSATEFLFGQSVGTLKKDESELGFAEAFSYSQKAIITRAMFGPLAAFYRDAKATKCNAICRDFARIFVDQAVSTVEAEEKSGGAEQDGRQKYIFSQALARHTSDRTRILDELMNILLAGRDTTASLLSNMFFMLAKNPRCWEKLRNEVAGLDGRPPTYEELRSLKYVQYCMNESLRLHPVVPRNERMALRDTVLPRGGGKDGLSPVLVPKGTLVAYNVYAMHRRTDFFGPDAEEFRPERWADGQLRPRWEYLPFNGGPRICVGQRYALTEVGYVLVRMAQEFKTLESRDPGPWEESLALTLCSRNGTKVSLTAA